MVETRENNYEVSVEQVMKVEVYDKDLLVGEGLIHYHNNGYNVGKLYSKLDNSELPEGCYDLQPIGDWHFIVTRKNDVNRH